MIGKWEKVHYGDYPFLAKCSRCGHEIDTHYEGKHPNFCSNCGLPMNEEAARRLKTDLSEEHKPECEDCDYREFTKRFIDGVVDVMTKNGISSVEELNRRLKGEES